MATFDHQLPTEEELTVPEVNLSSPALRAGAFHMGKHCENQSNVSCSLQILKFINSCYIIIKTNETHDILLFRNICCAKKN